MSEYYSPTPLPHIPDNLTIPQFFLDSSHPIRPIRREGNPWLIDDVSGKKIGLEELRTRTFGLSNALKIRFNIGENDVVCIFSSNHVDYLVAVWAAHRLGAVVSTANPAYTVEELVYQLITTKAVLVIAHPDFLDTAISAAQSAAIPNDRILLFDTSPPLTRGTPNSVPDLIADGLKQQTAFIPRSLAPGEAKTKVAFLCFSSGTTGSPKAVAIPHYAVIANVLQMAAHHRINDDTLPVDKQRFENGNVCTGLLPFFHIYGLVINAHFILFAGMAVVVTPKFNFIDMLKSIVQHRITHLLLVPPQLVLLCKHPAVKDFDLSHVKICFSGAAPLSVELTQQVTKVLPSAEVGQGYGMTETSTVISIMSLSQRIGNGSVGVLLPGVVGRVVKQDGTLAKPGESGELNVTGPSVALGYTNNDQATKETFVNGWVHTGDEVTFSEEGEMYVLDRLKELIKVRGFQVPPAELEGHLLNHPDVADACVVPIPDEYSGEIPLAFIVLRAEAAERIKNPQAASNLKAALIKYVADHKTRYKWLAGGVQFIDAIPKNPSGKLLRRVLRDKARQQVIGDGRLEVKVKL